jgi:hypothetical protein
MLRRILLQFKQLVESSKKQENISIDHDDDDIVDDRNFNPMQSSIVVPPLVVSDHLHQLSQIRIPPATTTTQFMSHWTTDLNQSPYRPSTIVIKYGGLIPDSFSLSPEPRVGIPDLGIHLRGL